MATSVARAAPAGGGPTNKARPVKRSHSLLVHSRPAPLAKERASSLKREQSLKEPRDHYSLHLVSRRTRSLRVVQQMVVGFCSLFS